jgi:hypothetical protein
VFVVVVFVRAIYVQRTLNCCKCPSHIRLSFIIECQQATVDKPVSSNGSCRGRTLAIHAVRSLHYTCETVHWSQFAMRLKRSLFAFEHFLHFESLGGLRAADGGGQSPLDRKAFFAHSHKRAAFVMRLVAKGMMAASISSLGALLGNVAI